MTPTKKPCLSKKGYTIKVLLIPANIIIETEDTFIAGNEGGHKHQRAKVGFGEFENCFLQFLTIFDFLCSKNYERN